MQRVKDILFKFKIESRSDNMNIYNSTLEERTDFLKESARNLLKKPETKESLTAPCNHCGRRYYKMRMHPKDEYGDTVYYCSGCVNIK